LYKWQSMTNKDQAPGTDSKPQEQIEISFFGIRFKCSGPTSKTIIILVLWLIFFLVLVLLLPHIAIVRWFSG
jgi:hypothetical protein